MTRPFGMPETPKGRKGWKQNSNGKPNNWALNWSPSNSRLHNDPIQRGGVPWKPCLLSTVDRKRYPSEKLSVKTSLERQGHLRLVKVASLDAEKAYTFRVYLKTAHYRKLFRIDTNSD